MADVKKDAQKVDPKAEKAPEQEGGGDEGEDEDEGEGDDEEEEEKIGKSRSC